MQVADFNQFGSAKTPQGIDAQHCARCEAMLADALDGTLSLTDQAAFDLHMTMCPSCSDMLADAQRGAAWLEMLKSPRPEPSSDLLERILAQTCNQASEDTGRQSIITAAQPNTILGRPVLVSSPAARPVAYGAGNVLPFRSRIASSLRLRHIGQTLLQPRLAMTAAMAFFSIALTMNLLGVHLSSLRLSDLKPSSIKRSFYEANAHVTRYYTNLKVVYELESRVRDLQRSNDSNSTYGTVPLQNSPATPDQKTPKGQQQGQPQNSRPGQSPDQKQSRPKPGPGSSQREIPGQNVYVASSSPLTKGQDPLPVTQAFVVFIPNVLKCLQEGELV
jgi:hypothetical protein